MLIYFWEFCIFKKFLWNGGKVIQKFKDIKEIYKIIGIKDEYILFKSNNQVYKKYIYEIIPVTLLDFSIDVQNSIYMVYNEFLREMCLDLQIYISNKKMNVENYIEDLRKSTSSQNSEKFKTFLNNYLIDIKEKLDKEKIYITKYYIIITIEQKNERDIKETDDILKKLNNLGCTVNRIDGKQNIENILYESINKESLL